MNLETSVSRARCVRGQRAAARLYNEMELAPGDLPWRLERIGEEALAILERRFPSIKEHAREVEKPPSLPRRAGERGIRVMRSPQASWSPLSPANTCR